MEKEFATRRVPPKDLDRIAAEWDAVAQERRRQIDRGDDLSLDNVLAPALLSALELTSASSVLDVGCGTGAFTEVLALHCPRVVGIDPSHCSIEQALKKVSRVAFVVSSIEEYAKSGRQFGAIAANMTMMNVPDLSSAMQAVGHLCESGGIFAFTITHPWFWPFYWNYAAESWFRYSDEIFIESEFRISRASSGLTTTHIHRPLEMYVEATERAGFNVKVIREPMPSPVIESEYPRPWRYPRFLLVCCVKA